ncbi:MAG: SagB/ThcOx family dehydrogenase [Candidatus Bathyarchaeota archaeon]|nr:SagB/ThcOx family dehydrogenase [Candidatus Bathyarchaeota archaeon]
MTAYRKYLKSQFIPGVSESESDQMKGLPPPPIQKSFSEDAQLVDLVPPEEFTVGNMPLKDVINNRRSRRRYTEEPLSLEELSFLLWATQGVQKLVRNDLYTLRTVPCGSMMHPYETYLLINRVEGVEAGIYRYLALEHKLCRISGSGTGLADRIGDICNNQTFVVKGAAVFIWSVRPYRTEWLHGEYSLKDILISVGHICQNLYLACESIGAGTCAILAYTQEPLDSFIGVDGEDEVSLYLAPVGKV